MSKIGMSAFIAMVSILVSVLLILGAFRSAKFNDSLQLGLWSWKGFSIGSESFHLELDYVYKHRRQFFDDSISIQFGREPWPGIALGSDFFRYRIFTTSDAATTKTLCIPYIYPIALVLMATAVSTTLFVREHHNQKRQNNKGVGGQPATALESKPTDDSTLNHESELRPQ